MRESLNQLCNNFITNRDTVNNTFKWENDLLVAAGSTTFLNRGVLADGKKLEQCI